MSKALSPARLRERIATAELDPLYLLVGDDDGEKDQLATELVDTIDSELRAFNVDRFHGGDADAGDVVEAARTLPVVVSRRLVLVLQAERLLEPKRSSAAIERGLEAMEAYFKAPEALTTLILVCGQLDRRRRLTTLLGRQAITVGCEGIGGVAETERWLRAQLDKQGIKASRKALRLMAERAAGDMGRLRADLERVTTYVMDQKTVDVDDVLEVTGEALGHDDWAVTRAIERGESGLALRALARALDEGAPPPMILGQLAWVARTKLPPGRIPAAISAVFRTDLDLKSSAGEPRILLERLVVDLCDGPGDGRVVV